MPILTLLLAMPPFGAGLVAFWPGQNPKQVPALYFLEG
jgi:hypothetical protein